MLLPFFLFCFVLLFIFICFNFYSALQTTHDALLLDMVEEKESNAEVKQKVATLQLEVI